MKLCMCLIVTYVVKKCVEVAISLLALLTSALGDVE